MTCNNCLTTHCPGWVISPDWCKFRMACAAQWPKFKIPFPRSLVPGSIEYNCQVSSNLAQQSQSLRVLKMLTPHGWTHTHVDRWMFDYWFCKLSRERWLIIGMMCLCRRRIEDEERDRERKRVEKVRRREERRQEREERRRLQKLETKRREDEMKMQQRIALEERKILIAQRKLETIRLLSELFARVKVFHGSPCPLNCLKVIQLNSPSRTCTILKPDISSGSS